MINKDCHTFQYLTEINYVSYLFIHKSIESGNCSCRLANHLDDSYFRVKVSDFQLRGYNWGHIATQNIDDLQALYINFGFRNIEWVYINGKAHSVATDENAVKLLISKYKVMFSGHQP